MGDTEKRLVRLFRRARVLDMQALAASIRGRSRRSLFRDLAAVGYLTSYTHAGRYYSLCDIAEFDEHGLWFHQGIGFSRAGTLKQTVARDVQAAEAGRTHRELERLLRVRVHNTLLGLVREGRIGRESFGRLHLYVSSEVERATEQVARREQWAATAAQRTPLSDEATIDVLVELLHAGRVLVSAAEVASRLAARGTTLTAEQVEQVYDRFGLSAGKKTPPPISPSSPQ